MNESEGWRTDVDRNAQREILRCLAEHYPEMVVTSELFGTVEEHLVTANIAYLEDHGLVFAEYAGARKYGASAEMIRITHKGLDFLMGDGGLGAILGVVTVKIHEDSIKDLIAAQINASELPQPDKQRYLDQLRELPAETTKHLVLKMVDAGLANWQKALPLLQSILG